MCYVVSNLMAVKVIGFFGLFCFDAGTITFPLAYMLGDVLTEIWGYRTARKTIIACFFDTVPFVLIAFLGVLTTRDLVLMIVTQYFMKLVIEAVFGTPMAYAAIAYLRRKIG